MLNRLVLVLACGLMAAPVCVQAQVEFEGSGFLTLAAGKIVGGGPRDRATELGWQGPAFIADYAQAGVYEDRGWTLKPDSKLGLQGTMHLTGLTTSITGQVVARGARDGKANLEWIYLSHEFSDKLTLQVGRKRIPFFYYSDSQDVGLAYPWVHLPAQMYGWEVVNYNGVSLYYKDTWGSWTSALNVFAGGERRKDTGYQKIYWGKRASSEVRWKDMAGAELSLRRDWLEARFLYLQAKTAGKVTMDPAYGTYTTGNLSDYKARKTYGVSLSAEPGNWVAKAEFLYQDVVKDYGRDYAQLFALGYRFGRYLPLISFANYKQQLSGFANPADYPAAEGHSNTSLLLRYDLTSTSAVKLQYDFWKDRSKPGYGSLHGDARLLSVSYDLVF